MLPVFPCESAIGNFWSIFFCIDFKTCAEVWFSYEHFGWGWWYFFTTIVSHNFHWKYVTLRSIRNFFLPLKRNPNFLKKFSFFIRYYHILLVLFHCKTYFLLHQNHLLITFFCTYILEMLLVINNYWNYNSFLLRNNLNHLS